MVEYLGTTVDAVHQAIADGVVLYFLIIDGFAIMPDAQFPHAAAGLVPRFGEMTALMDPD